MGLSQVIAAGAALSAFSGNSQHKRLMRLDFPFEDGPPAILLPNTLVAREEVSRGFRFIVEVLSDEARIPLKMLMGRMVVISLVREDGSLRYFNGHIAEFRFLRTDGGFAFYQMVLEPWLAFARLRMDNRSFHGKSVREITEETLKHYRQADWHMYPIDESKLTVANQHNETDYNHLHRRWEALGLHYWYEHEFGRHRLMISDNSFLSERIDEEAYVIPFHKKSGSLEDDGIHEWTAVRRLGSGQTTLATFDYKSPSAQRAKGISANQQGDIFPYEVYEDTGSYGFRIRDDGEQLATRRMEEADKDTQYFEAKGNERSVLPGRTFKLGGHFSAEPRSPEYDPEPRRSIDDRFYFILSVDHEVANNYQAGPGAPSHYENRLTCIRKDIRWRPGRNYNSEPGTYMGLHTAIVVGPAGADIHTDDYGRVKLQFHWNRLDKYDENSSPWIRVMTPAAGDEFGQIRLPRVGEEVAVVYANGNIDHPLILGAVYNGEHMPPWSLPKQHSLAGMRSRELGGGTRGNHLVLDDTKEMIQAQLKSDHQCSQLSLGHIGRIEDNSGRKDARGEGWELRTDGHGVARAAKGLLITTEARQAARGPMKDMEETARRIALAVEQHQLLGEIAQKNGAQEPSDNQDGIASLLQTQKDAVKGPDAKADSFPELTKPHLVLASAAGIATTTTGDTHIASDRHTALTTGKSLSLAVGTHFFASIRQSFRLFVQKAGMKMVASAGDIDLQALSDSIKLLAKLEITHTANRITISAKDEVVINGGGSYVKFAAGGIEHGTNGNFVAHAAHHSFVNAKNMEMAVSMPPVVDVLGKGRGALHVGSHAETAGRSSAGMPFKLFKDGAMVEQGQIDDKGNIQFAHELDASAEYKVELPTGQSFDIAASAYTEQHEQNAGVGYHGYENPGGALTDDEHSLDQDRIDANPWSSQQA
ncbi:type VI secretion system secreted protein VgrG [Massilia aurea]|uniref:Type VI secretion system secreted protein VgrG n=1 Tax=Massilia aurea TaxID=373040 RepID=A0A7W9X0M3_9BURK|nr:type VI secretion system Vgr family protein [Massilia aurea]MBB6134225.1 type VI secretion system secreted protein VgrG [Massilia aurea]